MNPPRQAIVIGCHVNGLGVIRSLAQKEFEIIAMCYDAKMDFAHHSRHVHEVVHVPHPRHFENDFVKTLIELSPRWNRPLIIETNDDIAAAISENKPLLGEHYRLTTPDWCILSRLIDKSSMYDIARQCGVPHPRSSRVTNFADLAALKGSIVFPCILKPVVGHVFFSHYRAKNFLVHSFEQLSARLKLCLDSRHEMMIQEIVPGPDSNLHQCLMYIDRSGRIRSTFMMRKLRQNPPQFGVARVAVSCPPIAPLVDYTARMAKSIGFTGIWATEFKLDAHSGQFKLIEINGRMPRWNWLAAYCGVNIPWLAYCDSYNLQSNPNRTYETDVHWIELAKDVSLSIRNHQREGLDISDYIEPYLSARKTFADVSSDDYMPFLKRIFNPVTNREL